jgi:hypothetical protein
MEFLTAARKAAQLQPHDEDVAAILAKALEVCGLPPESSRKRRGFFGRLKKS